MKMLIGSAAARHWYPEFRHPKDIDYISEEEILNTDSKFCSSFKFLVERYPVDIAPPHVLYTLKASHAAWDIHWDKTMYDIQFFQSKKLQIDEELFVELYKDCEERYGKKRAYLNKSNDEFFEDGVSRIYEHDSIHAAIAFHNAPLYELIKKDSTKALTSFDLFNQLSYGDKINLCLEEIYVTALERFLIPSNFKISHVTAFMRALKLLITSMSRGWFPKFIIQNYLDITLKKRYDYSQIFDKNKEKLIRL